MTVTEIATRQDSTTDDAALRVAAPAAGRVQAAPDQPGLDANPADAAAADSPGTRPTARSGQGHPAGSLGTASPADPDEAAAPERAWRRAGSARLGRGGGGVPSWPLVVLAAPAMVAVWSGWVRLGQMTGFGLVRPFPGLWNSLQVNTAITLPIGVEAYGAYALRAWLAAGPRISYKTRRFAKWSAIGSLLLGMSGQVAYHLLSEAGITRAPWAITMAVACLPVLVLGMGAALSHLLHADHATNAPAAGIPAAAPGSEIAANGALAEDSELGSAARAGSPPGEACESEACEVVTERLEIARLTATQLIRTGTRVSRRALREAGLRGSNAELSSLVKLVSADPAQAATTRQPSDSS